MKTIDRSKLKAILFDSTRCIGCRSCEEACDAENAKRKRKWSADVNDGFRKPPEGLSSDKWLDVTYHPLPLPAATKRKPFDWNDAPELAEEGQYGFARRACMHCVEPSCVSSCVVGALTKAETGAVVYDKDKCIGCRYCLIACPFAVPKWDWQNPLPYIWKCTMCQPRQEKGLGPACVDACPGGYDGPALDFGDRYALLYEAEKRVHENKDRYHGFVFGRDDIGGTGVLYLMHRNLTHAALGFPEKLTSRPLPDYSHDPMSTVPYWIGGLGAMFWGLHYIIRRRDEVAAEEGGERGPK